MSKLKPLGPEKLVEKEVLEACKQMGLDVDVYDSKATFSQARGGYHKNKSLVEGHPDLAGNDSQGVAVYVELKAKGRLRTLRPAQIAFLDRKIAQGCFAVAVDSSDLLFDLYLRWKQQGRQVLEAHLASLN